MTEDNEQENLTSGQSSGDVGKVAAEATFKLVEGVEPTPRDRVLDGILKMTEAHRSMVEDDAQIAKLQAGMLFLAQLGEARITNISTYMGNYLQQTFGSVNAIESPKGKASIARLLSSIKLMHGAFDETYSPGAAEPNRVKLREFMMRKCPSSFWQQRGATEVAINNIVESFGVSKQIASNLDSPIEPSEMLGQMETVLETDGLGLKRPPAGASEIELARWERGLDELFSVGWNDWSKMVRESPSSNEPQNLGPSSSAS